jgi:hypothetical protein
MKFRKSSENKQQENQKLSKDLLKKASNCKTEELENLLKLIESTIIKSKDTDNDLLMAKTMVTSRLASTRDK